MNKQYGLFIQNGVGKIMLLELTDIQTPQMDIGESSLLFSCELVKGGHNIEELEFKSHFNPTPYIMKMNDRKSNWVDFKP